MPFLGRNSAAPFDANTLRQHIEPNFKVNSVKAIHQACIIDATHDKSSRCTCTFWIRPEQISILLPPLYPFEADHPDHQISSSTLETSSLPCPIPGKQLTLFRRPQRMFRAGPRHLLWYKDNVASHQADHCRSKTCSGAICKKYRLSGSYSRSSSTC